MTLFVFTIFILCVTGKYFSQPIYEVSSEQPKTLQSSSYDHLIFASTESQRDSFMISMIVLACVSVLLFSMLLLAIIFNVVTLVGGVAVIAWMHKKYKNNILPEKTKLVNEDEEDISYGSDKEVKKNTNTDSVEELTSSFEDFYYLKSLLRNLKLAAYFGMLKEKELFVEDLPSMKEEEVRAIFDEEMDRMIFIDFLQRANENMREEVSITEKRETILDISEQIQKENDNKTASIKDPRSEKVLEILRSMSDDEEEGESSGSDEESYICAIPTKEDFDKSLIVKKGRLVSSGSYGTIETAYLDLGADELTIVAVKCIALRKRVTENFVRSEVEIMKRLKHQNLLNCFGCFKDEEVMYIVMEYIKSGDLYTLKSTLELDKKIEYLRQIADGMIYLHSENIIHRDLKNQNILLSVGEKGDYCKICDFGTSRDWTDVSHTLVGTVEYLAPEVFDPRILPSRFRTNKEFKKLIDIYAYGIMIWELICGRQPYISLRRMCRNNQYDMLRRINYSNMRPDLRYFPIDTKGETQLRKLKRLMVKCWQTDPLKRPRSFSEIKEYFDKHCGERMFSIGSM